MTHLYGLIAAVTVMVHISSPFPTPQDPHHYNLVTCTGIFVAPNEILTAGHCVEDARHVWIKTEEEVSYASSVIYVDKVNDLALLRVPKIQNHEYAKIATHVQRTDKVYTLNCGEAECDTWNEGVVSNLLHDPDSGCPWIKHSAAIEHGASGSGLFNSAGDVVGINTMTSGSFSYAVHLKMIMCFLYVARLA